MKKIIQLFMITVLAFSLLVGCGTITDDGKEPGNLNGDLEQSDSESKDSSDDDSSDQDISVEGTDDNELYQFQAEVMEAGERLLVATDPESNEYNSSDKISVGLSESSIITKDGKNISKEELSPGDYIMITYNGMIAESYPAQIYASALEVIGHNTLIDGYLAIIDDLYQEDPGLNGDIEMIALDTSGWSGLSDNEKEVIFMRLREIYGMEIIEGTSDELAEQGLINKDELYFPKGIHIILSDVKYDKDKEKISTSVTKWRSGLGAIGSDLTAKFKVGKWEITKKNMWIS